MLSTYSYTMGYWVGWWGGGWERSEGRDDGCGSQCDSGILICVGLVSILCSWPLLKGLVLCCVWGVKANTKACVLGCRFVVLYSEARNSFILLYRQQPYSGKTMTSLCWGWLSCCLFFLPFFPVFCLVLEDRRAVEVLFHFWRSWRPDHKQPERPQWLQQEHRIHQ